VFKEQYPSTIHVAFYPYSYVRVMAMKGKLYQRQDYDKLLKMQGNEIAHYLEESDYKQEIHELGSELSGYTLVERALYKNVVRNLQKLQRICSPDMKYLIQAYAMRHDIYNLKTILRAKASGQSHKEVQVLLLPLGIFSQDKLDSFLELDSVATILKKAGFSEREFSGALHYYDKQKSLLEIENLLDKQYYTFLFEFLTRLSGEHQLFKEFLQSELDVLNIKLLLRMKLQKIEDHVLSRLFFEGGSLFSVAKLRSYTALEFTAIITALRSTRLKHIIAQHAEELQHHTLKGFEKSIDVWLLQKSTLLLHQFPLSVDTLLGYMFAKEIEMRNLRVLVKGKQFQLPEQFIEQQLVIG
jgi:V/A-type H+-transporting ATPase subunit C